VCSKVIKIHNFLMVFYSFGTFKNFCFRTRRNHGLYSTAIWPLVLFDHVFVFFFPVLRKFLFFSNPGVQVSVPDLGDCMVPALATMYESLRPSLKGLNLWQVIRFSTVLHVLEKLR